MIPAHRLAVFVLLLMVGLYAACHAADTLPYDRVWLYEMKEDPTLPDFLGDPAAGRTFYGFILDEHREQSAILYREGDRLYRVDASVKTKGPELLLQFRKRSKRYRRENIIDKSGQQRDIVYPVGCLPEQDGWRHGVSFSRRSIRRDDDMTIRLMVGNTAIQHKALVARCEDGDCGPAGCGNWGKMSSSSPVTAIPVTAAPAIDAIPLGQGLRQGKISGPDILTVYAADMNAMLPPIINNELNVVATGYYTATLPYPHVLTVAAATDTYKIGVVYKRYRTNAATDSYSFEIQPLPLDHVWPAANKCGLWDSDPSRKFFDFNGKPAMYVQPLPDPSAAIQQPTTSEIIACGKSVVISIKVQGNQSIDRMTSLLRSLPIEEIEKRIGVGP